jgi:hypothetical protein
MLSKKLRKAFERECYYLEYYDKNRVFPFEKKKIDITLSVESLDKLKCLENRSEYIENLIKNDKSLQNSC